jgi:hypothetical protein
MCDQPRRVNLMRLHSLEQHRRGDGINQPCRDRDVAIPQALQMQIGLDPVHADIGDNAADAMAGSPDSAVGDRDGDSTHSMDIPVSGCRSPRQVRSPQAESEQS